MKTAKVICVLLGASVSLTALWGGFYLGSIAPGWAVIPIAITAIPAFMFGAILVDTAVNDKS